MFFGTGRCRIKFRNFGQAGYMSEVWNLRISSFTASGVSTGERCPAFLMQLSTALGIVLFRCSPYFAGVTASSAAVRIRTGAEMTSSSLEVCIIFFVVFVKVWPLYIEYAITAMAGAWSLSPATTNFETLIITKAWSEFHIINKR